MEAQVEKIASLTEANALKVEDDESSRRPSLIEQANKVTEARGLSRQHFFQQFVFMWARKTNAICEFRIPNACEFNTHFNLTRTNFYCLANQICLLLKACSAFVALFHKVVF